MSMKEDGDPDTFFLVQVRDTANKLYSLGGGVFDARLADIVPRGLPPPPYDQLRLMADIDSGFTLKKIDADCLFLPLKQPGRRRLSVTAAASRVT